VRTIKSVSSWVVFGLIITTRIVPPSRVRMPRQSTPPVLHGLGLHMRASCVRMGVAPARTPAPRATARASGMHRTFNTGMYQFRIPVAKFEIVLPTATANAFFESIEDGTVKSSGAR
jgi:hypothetical protein